VSSVGEGSDSTEGRGESGSSVRKAPDIARRGKRTEGNESVG